MSVPIWAPLNNRSTKSPQSSRPSLLRATTRSNLEGTGQARPAWLRSHRLPRDFCMTSDVRGRTGSYRRRPQAGSSSTPVLTRSSSVDGGSRLGSRLSVAPKLTADRLEPGYPTKCSRAMTTATRRRPTECCSPDLRSPGWTAVNCSSVRRPHSCAEDRHDRMFAAALVDATIWAMMSLIMQIKAWSCPHQRVVGVVVRQLAKS